MSNSQLWPDRWSTGPRQHGWPGMSFSVVFEMDAKQRVERIRVFSYRGDGDALNSAMVDQEIGPFDEMGSLVQQLIVESALKQYEQLRLDLE